MELSPYPLSALRAPAHCIWTDSLEESGLACLETEVSVMFGMPRDEEVLYSVTLLRESVSDTLSRMSAILPARCSDQVFGIEHSNLLIQKTC
jgi:hypothetical protein